MQLHDYRHDESTDETCCAKSKNTEDDTRYDTTDNTKDIESRKTSLRPVPVCICKMLSDVGGRFELFTVLLCYLRFSFLQDYPYSISYD